jgi:membrane protease YdiL (CAAX protease family)
MYTLYVVFSFPLILFAGYGLLFFLSGRNLRVMIGPAGFLLYLVLLAIPTGFVLATHPGRVAEAFSWQKSQFLWVPAGVLLGLVLWCVQLWGLPGRTPDASERAWVGPEGKLGFPVLMIPVAYIVVAEEVVWRAYLIPEVGHLVAAAAFALHHYHFGLRHVAFSFLTGLALGGLFFLAGNLWPAIAAHLVYNVLAWRHMRRSARNRASTSSDLTQQLGERVQ